MRYFTKSVFKESLECPTRLNYCNRPDYANQNLADEFLESLAEGGFQVGELAKVYYKVPPGNDLSGSPDDVARRTKELLAADNATIAEAGFVFGRFFCRVDIIRRNGNEIELVEVKAKSWDRGEDKFLSSRAVCGLPAGSVRSAIREYLYDLAFQKYVVCNALRDMFPGVNFAVKAALMMADKTKVANIPGLNQYFKIERRESGRAVVSREPGAESLADREHVLTPFWEVDEICDDIIAGNTPEQDSVLHGMKFVPFVEEMSARYCDGRQVLDDIKLSTKCFKCPYYKAESSDGRVKDGYDECWRHATAESDAPYTEYSARPLLEDLWGGGGGAVIGKLMASHKWFLDQVNLADISQGNRSRTDKPGLLPYMRRWVQIALATGRSEEIEDRQNLHDGVYMDIPGLAAEMRQWEFPLHMIDFETSAVALPFYENMHPYENVAFQFSHHVIDSSDGGATYSIRHAGQWINEGRGFPNFEFVRQLKQSVGDRGTIFRYSNHENTILRHIRRQLLERNDQEDTAELVGFIDSITHATKEEGPRARPPSRDMVDLLDVVKRFYYDPLMKGSNSIKAVLPAVLNSSRFLRDKYARAIYGSDIPSLNFSRENPKAWIREEGGKVLNPYKLLDGISSFFPEGSQTAVRMEELSAEESGESGDKRINNGGAALWAYGLLQFCHQDPAAKAALIKALYRYCELDTMAMVFIWEYFNHACRTFNGAANGNMV